jgi:hypothetical protein
MEVLERNRPLRAAKSTRAELTCKEAVRAMGDFLSVTLSPECRLQFTEHLKGCTECAAFLRNYKKTIEAIGDALKNHSRPTPVLKLRKRCRSTTTLNSQKSY